MLPPAKFFNARNRGYPDISAVGARTLIINGKTVFVVEGTSASTPIIASMISLLNDARLAMGKTPLGYLNPVLYKVQADTPTAFYGKKIQRLPNKEIFYISNSRYYRWRQ
jgi:tripeptidyl-peptidase-1